MDYYYHYDYYYYCYKAEEKEQHAIKIDESTNLRLVIIFNALHGRRRFALIFKLWQYRKSILMAWRVLDFLPSNISYSCRQMRKSRENSSYVYDFRIRRQIFFYKLSKIGCTLYSWNVQMHNYCAVGWFSGI